MSDMVNVRKAHAGTDSAGHTWPTDGAVIAVPVDHALALVRIPDGDFAIVEQVERSALAVDEAPVDVELLEDKARSLGQARSKPDAKER